MPEPDVSPEPVLANADDATGPPVTIVIPAYYSAATILRAVQSALSQNDGRVEIVIVVDDGRSDTQHIVNELGDHRVTTIVNDTNLGAPASRNRGLKAASSAYVAFLDADDYFEGDVLGPLVRRMTQDKAELGFGPSLQWDPTAGFTRLFVPDYRDHRDAFLRWFGGNANVQTAGVAWSTEYLRRVGGWDETIRRNQDGELAMRAILLGASFTMSSEGLAVWSNDAAADRITTRTDNLAGLFDVVDKFERLHSKVVTDAARLEGCSRQLLMIAHMAYRAGADDVGAEAMRRRRALNAPPHRPNRRHQLSVALRLIPRSIRPRLWAMAESLRARI